MSWFGGRRAHVQELESGELLISHAGQQVRFAPRFDFGRAVKMFETFSECHGGDFFDSDDGIDWFPAIQYFLFQKLVLPSILYGDALRYLEDNRLRPRFSGGDRFRLLYQIRRRNSAFKRFALSFAWRVERALISFHNRWLCRDFGEMFFQYSADEMRLKALRRELAKRRRGLTAIGGGFRVVLRYFFRRDYFLVATTRFDPLGDFKEEDLLLNVAHGAVSQARRQMAMYLRIFHARKVGPRFYGIDDPLYLFPLLFALNRSGVQTVGFQHGLYSQNDFGYAVRRCSRFEWYDKLVVWDRFWAGVYHRINPYYPAGSILVGIGSEQFDAPPTPNPNNRHVLCMYERFLDVEGYVYFLRALISAGFHLTVKMRPESSVSDLAAEYGFTREEMEHIDICDHIDGELLSRVSLIAGCKTSLLYSLLSVGRPVWVFESSYHYLEQVLALDNVHIVKAEDVVRLTELYERSVAEHNRTTPEKFDLTKALNHVMGQLDDACVPSRNFSRKTAECRMSR